MYAPFGVPEEEILSREEIGARHFDVLFASNTKKILPRSYWLAGAFVAIAVTQGFAELAQRLSFARFAIGLVHDARAEALGRLQREGAGDPDPGDLIARIVGDSDPRGGGIRRQPRRPHLAAAAQARGAHRSPHACGHVRRRGRR
jgi:hypothetical protein